MKTQLHLFRRTRLLEQKIDTFFEKFTESSIVYRLAIRSYLKEGLNNGFQGRLDRVSELESEADHLRREIEQQLYANTLIPDSRADVLELIEGIDQVLSEFEGTLWAFAIETPDIPKEFKIGYRKLTSMSIKAVDQLAHSARAFFYSPYDVPAYNHKVNLFEKEADAISTSLKTDIFKSKLELAKKLHLREFVEQIDGVADMAEDVADRLAIYAIKRLV
jgi:predicted phosphate transport protein (TIGR00153 family)